MIFGWLAGQAQQFNFKTYSSPEGLGQSQVYALLEDQEGYIWMGTQGGGLSRFDGLEFVSYSTKNGLTGNFIYALAQLENGTILIGTDNGLTIYEDGDFRPYFKESILEKSINAIVKGKQGEIWLGTNNGIYLIENEQLINFSAENGLAAPRVYCMMQTAKGAILAGTTGGLFYIENGSTSVFSKDNQLPGNDITALIEDHNGRIFLGIFGIGVFEWTPEKLLPFPAKTSLPTANFWAFLETGNGDIWLGSEDAGAFIWQAKDSTILQLDEDRGLGKNHVRALMIDRWNEVWVGTSGGGVSRYFGQQFIHFDKENGLQEEFVYAVETDTFGRIWLSQYDKGVFYYDQRNFHAISKDSVAFPFISKAIYAAKNGEIWVGTENEGLIIFGRDTTKFVGRRAGLPIAPVRAITEDLNGRMLVATAGEGIFRIYPTTSYASGYEIEQFTASSGISDNRVNDIWVDDNNRIWFATRWNGVGFLSPNRTSRFFTMQDGLPSLEVRTMAYDNSGLLWFGTADGLAKMDIYGDSLRIIPSLDNEKLAQKNIYLLKFDKENNLWIGSQSGVEKAILDIERNIQESQFFGQSEGFEGIETCQNAVAQDAAGNLWFGTMNGLTKYVSGTSVANPIPPILKITAVRLFYENLQQTVYKNSFSLDTLHTPTLSFNPNDNHLAFSFLGINLPNPKKVKYQWKLAGAEENWSPPSAQNQVMYPNLSPGEYTFWVRAANEDGVWSKPVRFSFAVRPHWWQTTWFKIALPLLILGIIGFIFKIRLNQIKAKAQQEKERLEVEKHLLELEQKALQLQMNPHFIFNALNTIQSQISEKDHQTARYQLAKFSKLMRAILENSRTTKISLETEIETLKSYLALEQFSRGDIFDYDIITDLEDEDYEIMIPPMLIQPFVENAVIHGIAHLQKKRGEIQVRFTQEDDYLICEIKDNGIGRHQAKLLKSQLHQQHRSVAMEVTRERLMAMEGDDESLIIRDLEGEKGTEVLLKIKLI